MASEKTTEHPADCCSIGRLSVPSKASRSGTSAWPEKSQKKETPMEHTESEHVQQKADEPKDKGQASG